MKQQGRPETTFGFGEESAEADQRKMEGNAEIYVQAFIGV